ncbi:hypothetical protein F5I97DRAFT_1832219 [Phlebopus sp. FC_14]|nr:hypothetical protein F5I97DRAFT_1832219 [Phlebopus sp. FC_14]
MSQCMYQYPPDARRSSHEGMKNHSPRTASSPKFLDALSQFRSPKPMLLDDTMFTQLTHLEVLSPRSLEVSSFGIEHLHRLTHVACPFVGTTDSTVRLCHILDKSPRLEVLVLLARAYIFPQCNMSLEKGGMIRDMRVVMKSVTYRNWHKAVEEWEGEETWEVAKRIVRWRRVTRARPFDYPPGVGGM